MALELDRNLEKQLGVKIGIRNLFMDGTLKGIAKYIEGMKSGAVEPKAAKKKPTKKKKPLKRKTTAGVDFNILCRETREAFEAKSDLSSEKFFKNLAENATMMEKILSKSDLQKYHAWIKLLCGTDNEKAKEWIGHIESNARLFFKLRGHFRWAFEYKDSVIPLDILLPTDFEDGKKYAVEIGEEHGEGVITVRKLEMFNGNSGIDDGMDAALMQFLNSMF
jgi:hypothetical protein